MTTRRRARLERIRANKRRRDIRINTALHALFDVMTRQTRQCGGRIGVVSLPYRAGDLLEQFAHEHKPFPYPTIVIDTW